MNAPGPSQSPVAKAGWLIALIFVGWLAFLFVPVPKPDPKAAPPYVKPPPSRLVALGLPDNPDLEQLPEFFALWADHAEWKDDKTIFAYWNPGSNSYSYFFEATRVNGNLRFQPIKNIEEYKSMVAKNLDEKYVLAKTSNNGPQAMPIEDLETEMSTHPIVFLHSFRLGASHLLRGPADLGWKPSASVLPAAADVFLKAEPLKLPKAEFKAPGTIDASKDK